MKYTNFFGLVGVSLICITMVGVNSADAVKSTTMFTFDVVNGTNGADGCSAKVTADANGCTTITERTLNNGVCQDTESVQTVCPGADGKTPTFAITDGDLIVTIDNQTTNLGKVKGDAGTNGTNGTNGADGCGPETVFENGSGQYAGCSRIKTTPMARGADGTCSTDGQTATYSDYICKGEDGKTPCAPALVKETGTGTYANCTRVNVQPKKLSGDSCVDDGSATLGDWVCKGDDGHDFDPCNGSTLSTVVKSSSRSYSMGTAVSGKNYYSTPGGITETRTMCDNSQGATFTTPDTCVEVARGNSGCPDGSVYKECKRADNGVSYNVCETGTSILDVATAAGTAAESANPCAGSNANSATVVKQVTTPTYDRGNKNNNIYSKIGTSQVQKTTCAGTTITETTQDMCIEVAKPSGVCTESTKAYMECSTSATSTDTTYFVCQDLGSSNSLAGKIDDKADSSTVTTLSGKVTTAEGAITALQTSVANKADASTLSGYVKTTGTDSNSIGKILESNNVVTTTNGKINSNVLPADVVQTTNGKLDTNLLTSSGIITTENLATNNIVTTTGLNSTLSGYVQTGNVKDQLESEMSGQKLVTTTSSESTIEGAVAGIFTAIANATPTTSGDKTTYSYNGQDVTGLVTAFSGAKNAADGRN